MILTTNTNKFLQGQGQWMKERIKIKKDTKEIQKCTCLKFRPDISSGMKSDKLL